MSDPFALKAPAAGGVIQRFIATSGSGIFTPKVSGGSWLLITACAGGGGSGSNAPPSSGGGGPGGVVTRFPLWVTGAVSWAVGAGGLGNAGLGTAGGSTTVGVLIITGGSPGTSAGATTNPGASGGVYGTGAVGAQFPAVSTSGGYTQLGTGATPLNNAASATNYGAGAGGSNGGSGFAGAGGYLIIEEIGR